MSERVITSIEELREIATSVLSSLGEHESAQVITLQGDLGVGKTAFTKEVARLLGITYEVTSPTFVIMKRYPIPDHPYLKKLTHIDAYRIEDEHELRILGIEDILNDKTELVCIEWPERVSGLIPHDAYPITLSLKGETRTITYGT